MQKTYRTILIVGVPIIALYFLFFGLAEAKSFLAPLAIAFFLSLVVYPIAKKLEKKRVSRSYAALFSTLIVFVASLGLIALMTFQLQNFISKWPEIKKTMKPKVEAIENYMQKNLPIQKDKINGVLKSSNPLKGSKSSSPIGERAANILVGTLSMAGTFLLTMIYIFFMLKYRRRFKYFLFKIFPKKEHQEIRETLGEISRVISDFLGGKLILMGILFGCYLIGLGISGVDNFILVSLIAVVLNLIPYLGNVIGVFTALVYGYLVSGDFHVLIGVAITFTVSLFVETYILQPYIMGNKVNLHPFLVIVMVILGGTVWGISGMVLAVPFSAILTVLLMHLPYLRKVGLLFSRKKIHLKD